MALVETSDIESWVGRPVQPERQDELVSAIAFAQRWVERSVGIRSLEKEATAKTVYIDGCKAPGCFLHLPSVVRPVWHVGGDLMTVTEDGASITVALGYSTSAGAVIIGANELRRVTLYRQGGWSTSLPQNIAVTCKVGFVADVTAAVNPLPLDVKRLLCESAWLMFNAASRVGVGSVAKLGSSADVTNDLSRSSQDTLSLLTGL